MIFEYFHPALIALQQELKQHPDILEFLSTSPIRDNADAFGAIAAKLGIILDGIYDPVDLAEMLLKKLKERNAIVVQADPKIVEAQLRITDDTVTIESAVPPLKHQH